MEWISVKEQAPPIEEYILGLGYAAERDTEMFTLVGKVPREKSWYNSSSGYSLYFITTSNCCEELVILLYWMPLPTPPNNTSSEENK